VKADEDRVALVELFATDLAERADRVEEILAELASDPEPARRRELVEALSLEAHNLTGTARTLGLGEVGQLAEGLQELSARIARGKTAVTAAVVATVTAALRSFAESCGDDGAAVSGKP
jgi:chemotaxis protein histidine kinase CheA